MFIKLKEHISTRIVTHCHFLKKVKKVTKNDDFRIKGMFLFIGLANCWSEEMLTIGMEVMFRSIGDTGPQTVQKALDIGDDDFERPSLAGSFLAFVEHAPYNTDCFNHWRYTQTPYVSGQTFDYTEHSNLDDLKETLSDTLNGIRDQTVTGAWPYSFAFKTMLGTWFEAYSPIHNIELFSQSDFPNGDNSGRNYTILYNGKTMSLHDFWDTGCGRYTKTVPFTSEQWSEIDQEVTTIVKTYPKSSIENLTSDAEEALQESYELAKEYVYSGVSPNSALSTEYVNKCKEFTDRRIAESAYALGSVIKSITVPNIQKNAAKVPMRTSEAIGWSITCLLAPLTLYIVWHYFQSRIKLD